MKERAVAMEKTRSLENLHELRLMALLLDVIREKGRMEAADLLGVNYKTLARAVETGSLSPRMSHALDRLLLSRESKAMAAQQERITALEGGWRAWNRRSRAVSARCEPSSRAR